MRWADQGTSISTPLSNYGMNLTHSEAYDRLWFTDRVLTEVVGLNEKIGGHGFAKIVEIP